MATIVDMLITKQAQAELDKSIASLKLMHEEIIKINQQGLKINSGASPKNPQQMNSAIKESIALTAKLTAEEQKLLVATNRAESLKQKQIQTQIKENALIKSTIDLKNKEVRERDRNEKALAKEEQKLASLQNFYNKTQQQLNVIQSAYNNLAAKKERYNNLTSFEENRLKTLQVLTEKYNGTLKNVDATIGKHTRNVGNYASGFNPLSNSINQLGREAPAFANSMQTGFMAISNNLPIFFDAMQGVINQNKELQAQGLPTKSALSQLAGALFSFQTLLSVGVTLLTLYGKEIVNWVGGLFGASEALSELNKNQKEFNKSRVDGKKESISERTELDKYIRTARKSNLPMEERLIALEKLRSQFPFYFKNLTDEQILNGNIKKNLSELNLALERRTVLQKASEANVKNKQRLVDLEIELKAVEKLEKARKSDYEAIKKIGGIDPDIQYNAFKLYDNAQKDRLKIEKDISAFQSAIAKNSKTENELKAQVIGLEYQNKDAKDKSAKSIKRLDLTLQDYIASEYELLRLQKQTQNDSNKAIFEDENQTLENRLSAYERYISGKTELEIDSFNENKRLLDLSYNDELKSLKESYSEYIKQEGVTSNQRIQAKKELDRAILALDKKTKADLGILEQQHSINIVDITKQMYEEQRKLKNQYFNLEENKKFQEDELRDLQQHQLRLKNINLKTTKERLSEIDELNTEAQQENLRNRLQLRVDEITRDLELAQKGSAEELKLRTELYQKLKEIDNLRSTDLEKKKKEQEEYLKLLDDTYKGFVSDFANQSGFSKMIDLFNGGLDKFKGDAAATALVVSEAFQQAFNTMSQMSDANYQQMYSNLERQRDVSILFAGESTTAREEIERQYEERRKRIQRQQAESQKRLAMFNIATNTAQAIMAVFAKTPPPAGIPLALLVGAIGAAQLALTAAQPIPQFYKGTQNAPEGLAWTDEKGAELHTDKNGKIKDLGSSKGARLKKLDKGDKIYTATQTKKMMDLYGFNQDFNNIMLTNGISTSNFNNNYVNLEPLNARIDRLTNVVANKSEVTIVNNESGTRYYERVNGQRIELVNSVLTMKSRTIK